MESTLSCKHQNIREAFIYKKTHSVVLMALVDANYKFITKVDVGCNGHISDGGVFSRCALSSALENKSVNAGFSSITWN